MHHDCWNATVPSPLTFRGQSRTCTAASNLRQARLLRQRAAKQHAIDEIARLKHMLYQVTTQLEMVGNMQYIVVQKEKEQVETVEIATQTHDDEDADCTVFGDLADAELAAMPGRDGGLLEIANADSCTQTDDFPEGRRPTVEPTTNTDSTFTQEQVVELVGLKLAEMARQYEAQVQCIRDSLANLATRDELDLLVQERDRALATLQRIRREHMEAIEASDLALVQSEELKRENAQLKRDTEYFKEEMFRLKSNQIAFVDEAAERYERALFNVVPLPSCKHGIMIGLTSSPELNGTLALCQKWHPDRGRWQVKTSCGRILMLKGENFLQHHATTDDSSS